jgi:hypothetical protein
VFRDGWRRQRVRSQRFQKQSLFDLAAAFRSSSAPKHVDGRDKPGHDAERLSCPPKNLEFRDYQYLTL